MFSPRPQTGGLSREWIIKARCLVWLRAALRCSESRVQIPSVIIFDSFPFHRLWPGLCGNLRSAPNVRDSCAPWPQNNAIIVSSTDGRNVHDVIFFAALITCVCAHNPFRYCVGSKHRLRSHSASVVWTAIVFHLVQASPYFLFVISIRQRFRIVSGSFKNDPKNITFFFFFYVWIRFCTLNSIQLDVGVP